MKRFRRPLPCLVAAALALAASPRVSLAQEGEPAPVEPDAAAVALQKGRLGMEAFDRSEYGAALALFREADALYHSPVLTLFIARSLRKLGKLIDARAAYRSLALEALPASAPPTWERARVDGAAELADLAREVPELTIVVRHGSAATRVTVDGAPRTVGVAGDEDPGRHRVEVVDGAQHLREELVLGPGERRTLTLSLAPPAPPPPPVSRLDDGPHTWRIVGIVSASVGGAALTAGAVLGGLALDRSRTADTKLPPSCTPDNSCPDFIDPADVEEHYEEAYTFASAADGLFIAGGVLAGAGILLAVLDPGGSVTVTAAPNGAVLRAAF